MKNKPILRWLLLAPFFGLMYFLGHIFVFFIYLPRDLIRKGKNKGLWIPWFFWLFLNDTTKGRDAGDFGRYSHNFIGFWKQNARRNSFWNLKLLISPKRGIPQEIDSKKLDVIEIETGNRVSNMLVLCNFNNYWGISFVYFTIKGVRYFRYSFTKVVFNGRRLWNVQFGITNERYVYKCKMKKI